MWRMMKKLRELGYTRPGLVIGDYEGQRSAHAYLCVYLGWSHVVLDQPPPVPVLRLNDVEEQPLLGWLERHEPDVVIFAHHYQALPTLADILRRHKIRTPADLGVAVVTQVAEGTAFSGLQGNQHVVGTCAVDLVVSRIMTNDFGLPKHPRVEMVEMEWVDGKTLRGAPLAHRA
jgi:LacI family transcriptional regulator